MIPMESWGVGFDERYPIHQQIVSRFSRSLVRGELVPGVRIPSIRSLAVRLKVNANTIRRAYQEMERDELIYFQQGTGYFVTKAENIVDRVKAKMLEESTFRFVEEMRAPDLINADIVKRMTIEIEKQDLVHGDAHS